MRSFDISAELSMHVNVPDKFLKDAREACQLEDASEFQKKAQEMYPTDDDEFLLMILRNGFKNLIRGGVIELCQASGIGGSFSPVQVKDRTPPKEFRAVLASEINAAIQ